MVWRDGSWRSGLARLFWSNGDQYGGDANHLDFALDDDAYTVTERTTGGENDAIGFGAKDDFGHLRCGAFIQVSKVLGVAHESEMLVADTANDAFVGQFS